MLGNSSGLPSASKVMPAWRKAAIYCSKHLYMSTQGLICKIKAASGDLATCSLSVFTTPTVFLSLKIIIKRLYFSSKAISVSPFSNSNSWELQPSANPNNETYMCYMCFSNSEALIMKPDCCTSH